MRCVYLFIALVAVLLLPMVSHAEVRKITLDEAVARAAAENRDIEMAKERLRQLKGLRGEALSQGLPQITGNGQYQHQWRVPSMSIANQVFKYGNTNQYTVGAQVNQLLFDGGRVFKAVKAAQAELQSGIEKIRSVRQQVEYQVKQTFYSILYTEKMIGVLENRLKDLKGHLSAIQQRYNKGVDSDYTLMRQDVEVANVEPDLIDAQRTKELLLNELKILLVISQEEQIQPVGQFDYIDKSEFSVESLVEKAKTNRPDLQAEKQHLRALEQTIGMEKSAYIPNLNFNTTVYGQGQSQNWTFNNGKHWNALSSSVNLTWNIFDGLKTHSKIQEAKALTNQQRLTTSKLEDEVVKNVHDAHLTLQKARQTLETQKKSLGLARKTAQIASQRFEAGLMSQLELLDTLNSRELAEQQYLKANLDCYTAEAGLRLAIGEESW